MGGEKDLRLLPENTSVRTLADAFAICQGSGVAGKRTPFGYLSAACRPRTKRDLLDKITDIQHDYHELILCSQHIHLDHDNCMEIIAVKGKASLLKQLANALTAVKGIIHGELSMTKIS